MIEEYETFHEKIFILRKIVEIRIPKNTYAKLRKRYSKEHIISFCNNKKVVNKITGRPLVFITKEVGIPLLGHSAFGIIDRGTNLLQVRCITGCNLSCIFCSVDEGRASRTRKTDFIVDPDYMIENLRKIVKYKGSGIEIHLDAQGEPTLYPYLERLVEELRRIKEIKIISMQTNGTLLDDERISCLEKYVTRINLSLNTLDEKLAKRLHGRYSLKSVLDAAEMIANSKMDLLIAPVWLPGYNDKDIPRIIEFALDIGAGKKFPPLGIQKYIRYRFGRKIPKTMSFNEFYSKLSELEKEYGIKLILSPEDFGMTRRPKLPTPFKVGEILKAKIVADGRMLGEKICVKKDRSIAVLTNRRIGEFVKFKVVRVKDGIIVAVEKK